MIDERRLHQRGLFGMIKAIADRHSITMIELGSAPPDATVSQARREAYAALYEYGLSSTSIGAIFGRDHSTILSVLGRRSRRKKPRYSSSICPSCNAQITWQDPPEDRSNSSFAIGTCGCSDRRWELRARQERIAGGNSTETPDAV